MNKLPTKQAIITALIVAVTGPVLFAIADKINMRTDHGMDPMLIRGLIGLLMLIILGVGIYYGMQNIKQLNGGKLSYALAVKAGVLISVITGIITAIFTFIYCQYIDPGFAKHVISESIAQMMGQATTLDQMTAHIKALGDELTTSSQVMQALVGQSVCGTIITLVMGAFVKTKKQA